MRRAVRPFDSFFHISFLIKTFAPSPTASVRSVTPIKAYGSGAFGTVWLCDWHGSLPPNLPVSTMQSVVGTRPEYANMRLVAVKRMKKKWQGGWDECRTLKELQVRTHPTPRLALVIRKIRRCGQYLHTQISYHCMIHFLSPRPKNSISSSSQWRDNYTSS
jgi:hypothetical protein